MMIAHVGICRTRVRAAVELHYAALPLDRDDALLDRVVQLPRLRQTSQRKYRARRVITVHVDRTDAEDAIDQRLDHLHVVDVPEFDGVDALAEQALLVVDAVVADAV